MNLFADQLEQTAIERIQKFAKIAGKMGFEVCLGFSGGKDSQVCYDLCKRSGIVFKAYYNVAFESNTTKRFISEHYAHDICNDCSNIFDTFIDDPCWSLRFSQELTDKIKKNK